MVCSDWFYYIPYSCKAIAEREFEILGDSPRPMRPVNFQTGFDHDVSLPGLEEDDENDRNDITGRMSGEQIADDDVVDDRSAETPVDNAYADKLEVYPVG